MITRPVWLTMPEVTVSGSENGLPIATTGSPTIAESELANLIGCSSEVGTLTLITPTSEEASEPSTLAGTLVPSWKVTSTLIALATTCSSVRMSPLSSYTTPAPSPSSVPPLPNRPLLLPLALEVTRMSTTPGASCL